MDDNLNKITAKEGYIFRRKIDGVNFGSEINLGIDYSTGEAREDKHEFYEEVEEIEIKEDI